MEAVVPEYSTREEPISDTEAEAVRPSVDQASETPPNNEAEDHLTDHSEAVPPGAVHEAEATAENKQDIISPSEDQASTVEKPEAVLPGGIQEAEATLEKEQDAIAPLEDQASTLQTVKKPNSNSGEGPNQNTNELAAEGKQTTQVAEEEPTLESPEKARSEPIAAPTKKHVNKLGRKVPRKQLLPIGRKFGAGKQLVPKRIVDSSSSRIESEEETRAKRRKSTKNILL